MKDLIIEYRNGKFVQLMVDGVEMKHITSIQFSHNYGEDLPTLTISGQVFAEYQKGAEKLEEVDKQAAWRSEVTRELNE